MLAPLSTYLFTKAGLEQDPGSEELLELKEQLDMLVQLTREGLEEQRKSEGVEEVVVVEEVDGVEGDANTSLEEDLDRLVGVKVSAKLSK